MQLDKHNIHMINNSIYLNNTQSIIKIFQSPPKKRRKDEIELIVSAVQMTFLEKFQQKQNSVLNLKIQCATYMTHLNLPAESIVFEIGSIFNNNDIHIDQPGDLFYLILRGTVGIYMKNQNNLELVKEMHAAQQFGELALIDHKKRKATVVCHTDCDFGVLSKEDFDLILKEEHQAFIERKMNEIGNHPLFSNCSKSFIRYLYFNSLTKHYHRNQVIFKQGAPIINCYLVRSGDFCVRMSTTIFLDNRNKEPATIEQKILQELSIYNKTIKMVESIKVDLKVFTTNDLFGEEDMLSKKRVHSYEVICQTQGTLVCFRQQDFSQHIFQDLACRNYLETIRDVKTSQFEKRVRENILLQMKQTIVEDELSKNVQEDVPKTKKNYFSSSNINRNNQMKSKALNIKEHHTCR